MGSFGKKLKDCREGKGLSQSALAKAVGLHHSIIGRYERGEANPTVDAVVRIAKALDTTVGYLLGETQEQDALKDPVMMRRLNDILAFPEEDKKCILYTLDAMIRNVKTREAYA